MRIFFSAVGAGFIFLVASILLSIFGEQLWTHQQMLPLIQQALSAEPKESLHVTVYPRKGENVYIVFAGSANRTYRLQCVRVQAHPWDWFGPMITGSSTPHCEQPELLQKIGKEDKEASTSVGDVR